MQRNTRKTTQEFISDAISIHGDKYTYDKVKYVKNNIPVIVTCPFHGDFSIKPLNHLNGHGCQKCKSDKLKSLVAGIGINDTNSNHREPSYIKWVHILGRCYKASIHATNPTYKDCSVCDEWKIYSNFKRWYDENGVDGYDIDKDILVKGNKVYSPETCCFVPSEINVLFTKGNASRNGLPVGVSIKSARKTKPYVAQLTFFGVHSFLGYYDTPEEAFAVYKSAKESHIKKVAQEYWDAGAIAENVYKAMMRYEVEITD